MSSLDCPVCNGRGVPTFGKGPCLCGGAATIQSAFSNLQVLYVREVNGHQQTQESLKALQRAVLEFVFDPRFKNLDQGGYFRRYWETRLECTIFLKDGGNLVDPAKLQVTMATGAERQEKR